MMVDMKEFLKDLYGNLVSDRQLYAKEIIENDLFVFLWERGGKKAIGFFDEAGVTDFEQMKVFAQIGKSFTYNQDFLDCVAIDEKRVKQLIKEKEKVKIK